MFTGIIDHCGVIVALEQRPNLLHVLIECEFSDLKEGESIAVDGICLTAINPETHSFSCDISPETLQLTTAKEFAIGRRVNLERALCLGDRLGGHWVTGHVDQCGHIQNRQTRQEFVELSIGGLAPDAMVYLMKKGSITVNGVSLTINEVLADGFQIMLIPHTLERTNLSTLTIGDRVNLEYDWMSRLVINQLKQFPLLQSASC